MTQHNVYFWLKADATDSQIAEFETGLKKMVTSIPQIKQSFVGSPAETPVRPVSENSFNYSISLLFDNVESHNKYQVHANHDIFVADFSTLWEKVMVIDSEGLYNI